MDVLSKLFEAGTLPAHIALIIKTVQHNFSSTVHFVKNKKKHSKLEAEEVFHSFALHYEFDSSQTSEV